MIDDVREIRYVLEIHAPDDGRIIQLEATGPFGAMHEGELINIRTFLDVYDQYEGTMWRVARIEHMIHDTIPGKIKHQIVVHTDSVPDDRLARQDERWEPPTA